MVVVTPMVHYTYIRVHNIYGSSHTQWCIIHTYYITLHGCLVHVHPLCGFETTILHVHNYTYLSLPCSSHKCVPSLAASPSPPGRSRGCAAKRRVVGGEGLANFALDHVFLECQLHVTCEPVVCQFESRTSSVPWEASR